MQSNPLLLAAAAAAAFTFTQTVAIAAEGARFPELKFSAAQVRAQGIEVAPLVPRSGGTLGGLPAQVAIPAQQVHVVSAPLAGFVERIEAGTQQSVRRGELLARLQSPPLAELQRALVQAGTQEALLRRDLERDEKLLAEGIIAERRYFDTRSRHAEARAQLAERRQALQLAGAGEASGSVLRIVAPLDGVVLEQYVQPGQRVEAAAPLFRIAKLDPLWLEIQVPAAQAATLAPGAAVSAKSAALPVPVQGRLISIGRILAAASQTVPVRALVEHGADRLQAGQLLEAQIAQAPGAHLYALPAGALLRIGGRVLVFVRTPAGFRAQPVSVSADGPLESVVGGEFSGSEQVAVRGVAALKAAMMGIGAE